jgi:hypothetical protein
MAGGLLNLIAIGNANVFLTGNPTKTFFRTTYCKYSNFGLQKFRIDYTGSRDLRTTDSSTFKFKIPRYADLLMDTYLVITLPDIWSPIYPPTSDTNETYVPYEFRWIEDLGTNLITEIEINCGSFCLARYSGAYLAAMVDRDFTTEKKQLFKHMTGNIPELNDPGFAFGRTNTYPNAYNYDTEAYSSGSEPSIRGRNLYIPLNAWFTLNSRCAFPMIALQYNELEINVTLRPIQELFQVRDVFDSDDNYPYVKPDFTQNRFQMYRFLQSPLTSNILDEEAYNNTFNTWNSDVHLLCNYAFLSKEESKQFAQEDQVYLVKEVISYNFQNISGTQKIKLENSTGMVSSWMWFFQRNDANMRNEWSNYTNWPYRNLPADVTLATGTLVSDMDGTNTGLFISGPLQSANIKEIMISMGILLDGKYRENTLPRGVFDYIEKYTRTNSFAKEGLYCYQFCLDTNPNTYQPSGAMNLGKFKNIELEFSTLIPEIDKIGSNYQILCDDAGNAVGINKSSWKLYEYTYNLVLFEERYNIISFIGGNCGMLYAK